MYIMNLLENLRRERKLTVPNLNDKKNTICIYIMFVYFKSNLHVFFSPFGSFFLTSIFMFFIRIKYMHLGRKTHTLNPSTVINICIEKKRNLKK